MARSTRQSNNGRHDPSAQSIYGGRMDHIAMNRLQQLVANGAPIRYMSGTATESSDPRRDINDECGYPKTNSDITIQRLRYQFDRNPIASRVVKVLAKASWAVRPFVYEDEDEDTITPFEQAWLDLPKLLRGRSWYGDEEGSLVYNILQLADIRSGIGSYGAIVVGINDGRMMNEPVAGVEESYSEPVDKRDLGKFTGNYRQWNLTTNKDVVAKQKKEQKRTLLYLRPLDESMCTVLRYENNPSSPRFGQPVTYQVYSTDPYDWRAGQSIAGSVEYHWTRVVHVSEYEIFHVPRMRPVYNRLHDLDKEYGAAGESYWRGAILSYILSTIPQLGGDAIIDYDDLKDQIELFQNGFQRWLALTGMQGQPVAPQVADPRPHIEAAIDAICIEIEVPKRKFIGSERGELASSQDDGDWNDVLNGRRKDINSPRIVAPLVDRLIMLGELPEPASGEYKIDWPAIDAQSASEKAAVATARVGAINTYASGSAPQIMAPIDFWTREMGYEIDEAEEIIGNAEQQMEEKEEEARLKAEEMGFEEQAPPGFVDPEQRDKELEIAKAEAGRGGKKEGKEDKEQDGSPFPPATNTENVFCPTGPGGGVDPTCSPGTSSSGGASGEGRNKYPTIGGKSGAERFTHTPVNPNAGDTLGAYRKADGTFNSDRQALHDSIISEAMGSATPVDKPTAYVMGGGPASGKSAILREGGVSIPANVANIDPDVYKTKLPEYQAGLATRDIHTSAFVHEESSYIGGKVLDKVLGGGYNAVLDGTGDSSIDRLSAKINKMREAGHKVVANYVTVDTDTAVARAQERGQKTGRHVPESVIRDIHAGVSKVVPQAIKRGLFDEFNLWDTNGAGAKKIASAKGSKLKIHDQAAWDRFVAKGSEGG